jgi:hypothetical protein
MDLVVLFSVKVVFDSIVTLFYIFYQVVVWQTQAYVPHSDNTHLSLSVSLKGHRYVHIGMCSKHMMVEIVLLITVSRNYIGSRDWK